jgi:4-hydroxythreonine-4-phosphate dehydrogenase
MEPMPGATQHHPPVAVTIGDPSGIGPDVTLAAWHRRIEQALPPFALYGEPGVLKERARQLGLSVPIETIASLQEALAAFGRALPVLVVGGARTPNPAGDVLVRGAIEEATAAVIRGEALALRTNPATKKTLQAPGLAYPGHTELLAVLASRLLGGGTFRPVMMLVADDLKVVPTTVHIPLSAVPRTLTRELLITTIRTVAAALVEDFGISAPRLSVCGLNPHAGEDGMIGTEDRDVIAPAIAALAAEGIAVTGPHSADTMFHAEARRVYDAAIAMYHDQALIPLKTLAFDRGVNVTLGLPFVRTSPDHGTAMAIAGTGKARPGSFIAALRLAHELGLRRAKARGAPRA